MVVVKLTAHARGGNAQRVGSGGVPKSTQEHAKHYEPFQDPSLKQKYFHIILDMFKDSIVSPDMSVLPHEVYGVRRDTNGGLLVQTLQARI